MIDSIRLAAAALILGLGVSASAQPATTAAPAAGEQSYVVFLRARQVGEESVTIAGGIDGWTIRGTNRLGPPLDVVTKLAEIKYDREWRPTQLVIDATARGQTVSIKTTFANGQANSELVVAGTASTKSDAVAADTVVLPNAFLGSYAALARRLVGQKPGLTLRGYIAPQGEVPMRVDGVFAERIETPREAIAATRYSLIVSNPPPAGEVPISLWTDAAGTLLRMSIPSQGLDIARSDVASAATRTSAFSIAGDEVVRIPASGFSLAAALTKPANATAPLPVLILISGSGPADRDGFVAGIPVLGQMAEDLVAAGFAVVRYDKRGVGQSGGRTETATLGDYAEDARAIVTWLEKRKDIDKKRIGVVGHSEGGWIALHLAARDRRVAAIALVAAPGTTGAELVLEQQRRLLAGMNTPDADREAKIAMQQRINAAVVSGGGWDGVPEQMRSAADTPWFQSFLAFDPARVMKDVRQPVLIVQGELDTQVPPHHADRLADLARARSRKAAVDVAKVPGLNHLLVPATTGEVAEYASLTDRTVSEVATAAIASWMARHMK